MRIFKGLFSSSYVLHTWTVKLLGSALLTSQKWEKKSHPHSRIPIHYLPTPAYIQGINELFFMFIHFISLNFMHIYILFKSVRNTDKIPLFFRKIEDEWPAYTYRTSCHALSATYVSQWYDAIIIRWNLHIH